MSDRLDCWNEIGVTGDRSCTELVGHTHCRNCPTYAVAASSRLDRAISEDSIDIATSYYSAPREVEDLATDSCLVFRVGAEWLAIPARMLDEVVVARPTHSLPHRRGAVKVGLVSVRGDIIVHVSLAGLLGIPDDEAMPPAAGTHRRVAPRIVVLADARGRVAVSVDEAMGFHCYDPATLRAVPTSLAHAMRSYATAMLTVGDRIVGVLDGPRVTSSLSMVLA